MHNESYIKPTDKVRDRLDGVKEQPNGSYKARCPAHPDHNPSLSISEGNDGRVLINCFVGCETADIVDALGLTWQDLYPSTSKPTGGEGGSSYPLRTPATLQSHPENPDNKRDSGLQAPAQSSATVQPYPCNRANYGRAKGLPVEYLDELGLTDIHYMGAPAIRIPYRNPDRSEAAIRFRTALEKTDGRDDRFRWRNGSKPTLYGLERLEGIREAGYVVLVEGESDCHTLWYHGIPALGVPGANNWKAEWSEHLDGLARIYVVREPDQGGDTLVKKLAETESIASRLYVVELTNV